ncbi:MULTISPECIES: hypothetical protein [unclassified Helicobacter]|nr:MULTISPECIES: hypothetical protein [unclassified Helicobacter]
MAFGRLDSGINLVQILGALKNPRPQNPNPRQTRQITSITNANKRAQNK